MAFLRANYPRLDIEVDGGLGPSTIDVAAQVQSFSFSFLPQTRGPTMTRPYPLVCRAAPT